MKDTLGLLVVDDHKILLNAFADFLRTMPHVGWVDTASGYEGMHLCMDQRVPDVVFLDLNLPPYNGIEICRELREQFKDLCIVILTSYNNQPFIDKAERNGANAYFLKSVDMEVVMQFLEDYRTGRLKRFVVSIPGGENKPSSGFENEDFELSQLLTPRERETMLMIVAGAVVEDIMKALDITRSTYNSHRANILHKLNLKNTAELTGFAIRNNLIKAH